MKILVINGPNMNMLGVREPNIYGKETYKDLVKKIKAHAKKKGVKVKFLCSNHEGVIVDNIHRAYGKIDGIVINPAAYTHTSIAILDALKTVGIPTIEVHISEISERESFRQFSYISLIAKKVITGHGTDGYLEAIDELCK